MSNKDFFGAGKEEHQNFRMGSELTPVDLKISMVEIASINSGTPLIRTIILSDGQELDLHIYLETERSVVGAQIKEMLNENST